jgi:hypothetical protein
MRYYVALKALPEVIHMSDLMRKVQATNCEEQSWRTKAPKKKAEHHIAPPLSLPLSGGADLFSVVAKGVRPATLTTHTWPCPLIPLRLASIPFFPHSIPTSPQNAPRSPHRPRREAERGQVQHAQFADGCHLQSRWVAHSQPSMPTTAIPTGGTSPRERGKTKGNSS